jgi:predicted aspartyl protease
VIIPESLAEKMQLKLLKRTQTILANGTTEITPMCQAIMEFDSGREIIKIDTYVLVMRHLDQPVIGLKFLSDLTQLLNGNLVVDFKNNQVRLEK